MPAYLRVPGMRLNDRMNSLKILHLYSNHKWTGPADHALNLVSWLKARPGIEAFFACGRRRGMPNHLLHKAGERNIACEDGMFLNKHLNWRVIPDVYALKKLVYQKGINLIHSHQDNDSLIAILAGFGDRLIRTCYTGEPFQMSYRQRFIFARTAKIMTASVAVKKALAEIYPDKTIEQIDIPVDLERFNPTAKNRKLMTEFGLNDDDPVAGIAARVQKHKNFSLLLDALELVIGQVPNFRFLIVGRGTHIDDLARRPAKARGLARHVIFTGYRREDYPEVVNLMDFKVFLAPGSDGSCRAVREALACGKPVIATRKGILPELIRTGETGILIDETPADLCKAMVRMCRDGAFLRKSSQAARQYAANVLNPDRYVSSVLGCYDAAAAERRRTDILE